MGSMSDWLMGGCLKRRDRGSGEVEAASVAW